MAPKIKKAYHLLTKTVGRFPRVVQLEITNRCNFNCKMCPRDLIGAPNQDMPWEVFLKITKKIKFSPEIFILTGWGEPLIHPDFFKIITFLNKRFPKSKIKFTTNGFLLSKEKVRQILRLRIYQISASLDEIKDEIKIESGVSSGHPTYGQIIKNVKNFIKLRGKQKYPLLCLQMILQPNGSRKAKKIIKFAKKSKIDLVNLARINLKDSPGVERPGFREEQGMIKEVKVFAKELGVKFFCINEHNLFLRLLTRGDKLCLRPDDYIYIDLEGNVTPCCSLRYFRVGNLLEENLEKIWNGKKIQQFRKKQSIICRDCDALSFKHKVRP